MKQNDGATFGIAGNVVQAFFSVQGFVKIAAHDIHHDDFMGAHHQVGLALGDMGKGGTEIRGQVAGILLDHLLALQKIPQIGLGFGFPAVFVAKSMVAHAMPPIDDPMGNL